MKRVLKIIPLLIPFLIIFPTILFAGEFKVTRVYDGYTLKAEGHDIEIKVRLVGIDAPETSRSKRDPGQPYSQNAKKYLSGLVLNKAVEIKGYGLCPYNRILGVVYLDSKNINLEMVKAGLAEVYRGKPPRKFDIRPYLEAEKKARESGKGMWASGDKYISPMDWRKMHKGK